MLFQSRTRSQDRSAVSPGLKHGCGQRPLPLYFYLLFKPHGAQTYGHSVPFSLALGCLRVSLPRRNMRFFVGTQYRWSYQFAVKKPRLLLKLKGISYKALALN